MTLGREVLTTLRWRWQTRAIFRRLLDVLLPSARVGESLVVSGTDVCSGEQLLNESKFRIQRDDWDRNIRLAALFDEVSAACYLKNDGLCMNPVG